MCSDDVLNRKVHSICFDASLDVTNNIGKEGIVGIGLYDITANKKLSASYLLSPEYSRKSDSAEKAALFYALHYIKKLKVNARLFSDNLQIVIKYKDILPVGVSLTWIPRELNTVADLLSKDSRKVSQKTNVIDVPTLPFDIRLQIFKKIVYYKDNHFGYHLINIIENNYTNPKIIIYEPTKKNIQIMSVLTFLFGPKINFSVEQYKHILFYKKTVSTHICAMSTFNNIIKSITKQ